jgi:hypothetical protein
MEPTEFVYDNGYSLVPFEMGLIKGPIRSQRQLDRAAVGRTLCSYLPKFRP